MPLRVEDGFIAVFTKRNLVPADFRQQQRVVNVLRPHVLQPLIGLIVVGIVRSHDELVLQRNPKLEILPVAHHIEGRVPHHRRQALHAQHSGFARQHVAANLLVVGGLAVFRVRGRSVDIHGRLHGLNLGGLRVDVFDQLLLGRGLQRPVGELTIQSTCPEQTSAQRKGGRRQK